MLSKIIRYTNSAVKPNKYYGLDRFGIKNNHIIRNPSVTKLYEIAALSITPSDPQTTPNLLSSTGAMVAYSGKRTGRTPKEKRIVYDDVTKDSIWWGDINIPINPDSHKFCKQLALKYLNTKRHIYIIDGYAGWDPKY